MAPRKPTCNAATDYTCCNWRYTFPISFGEASSAIRKVADVGEVSGGLFLPHPLFQLPSQPHDPGLLFYSVVFSDLHSKYRKKFV
ncbi:hypothetical protein Hanom_Chr05g00395661 [Helianthus anomalus]